MKKRLVLLMAGLVMAALCGCSRVPDDRLTLVQAKYGQLQALFLQAQTLMGETAAGGELPDGLQSSFEMMEAGVAEIGGTVESRLEAMNLAELDRLLEEIDGTVGVLQELVPRLEELRDLYIDGGLVEKTTRINEKIKTLNDGMQHLVNLVNSAQAAGNTVPQSVVAEIQALSAEMMAFGGEYAETAAGMSLEAYDTALEKLDRFIGEIEALAEAVAPLAAGGA